MKTTTVSLLMFLLLPGNPLLAAQTDIETEIKPPIETETFTFAPTTHIYTPYLADPKRVTFAFQALSVSESNVPDNGRKRFGLRLGGRLELFQHQWPATQTEPVKRLQANLEVGYRGYFDYSQSQDEIGWDGNYGLLFSYRGSDTIAYRLGVYHNSAHLGDEYIERTGRKRINYTREEYLAGMQVNFNPQWQVYVEGGLAYKLKDKPLQRKKRAQMGLQYQHTGFEISGRLGWYAAADYSAYEERDWFINKSYQIGFSFDSRPHIWRLALEYHHGQIPLGEFFQHDEKYSGIGLYLDI